MTLKSYLTAIILLTITLVMLISGGLLVVVTKQTYLDGVSQRGIELAQVLANDRQVINAITASNALSGKTSDSSKTSKPVSLQDYIEAIRATTNASYIVVTNRQGIRLSHPMPERIGRQFIGADIWPTLQQGLTRTTEATGSLGSAIRNFAPVYAADSARLPADIIGAVSIGYLEQSVAELLFNYYLEAVIWLGLVYLLAVMLTLLLLSKLKRTFLQYEPEDIVQRFKEYSLLLNSIREGIIAIDREHRITAINDAAGYWLAPEQSHPQLIGKPLQELSQGLSLLLVASLSNQHKHAISLGDQSFAVTLYPLKRQAAGSGFLIVLNHQQDMSELEHKLATTTAYARQLRTRTHEHINKLNVLSGLLQADNTTAAIEYLQRESDQHQHLLGALVKSIENSPVAAMLLAKYNTAQEQQIGFVLDEDSQLGHYSQSINDDLITLLGNLIDNAFDAALNNPACKPHIGVFISDRTNFIMITVEDSGSGVDEKIANRIYDLGVSAKSAAAEHGVGLYLVSRVVHSYNGSIDWERGDNTTVFSVYLDKHELPL
nr:sensor histidine kinase [Oceanobacter mangrovi]